MAKISNDHVLNVEPAAVLWRDRKRIMGLPLSFTVYEVTDDRFILRKGFLRTETNETLLYRILDIKMVQTLGQKLNGVGTITLYSADQSHHTLEIKNIKHPDKVRRFLSDIIEKERAAKGVRGREVYGTAAMGMHHDENCDHGPDMPPPPVVGE